MLPRFSGASSFKDLYTIVQVSRLISFSIDGQRSSCNRGAAGVSKGLLVTILAALFCNFCKVFSLVAPQHPQTAAITEMWLNNKVRCDNQACCSLRADYTREMSALRLAC